MSRELEPAAAKRREAFSPTGAGVAGVPPRIVCATAMGTKFAVDAPNAAQPSHRNQSRSLGNANSQKVFSNPTQTS